jgi:CheY-like chemotaxis protein/HPt (histidine-containing phosphotransfer) domain-containing protein
MLTSIGSTGDTARCRKMGVDGYLSKPVKHSDLLDALAGLFGVSTRRPAATGAVRPSAAPVRRLRVLVAEDNPVNRKLVTKLLQKRGHKVTSVEDGRQAVTAMTSSRAPGFDVVLMDLQMPELSGLEATEAIRGHEASRGGRVPIVALTAHAMQGDRERCLAAGMDGYLSKPIDVDELIATVESAGQAAAPADRAAAPPDEASPVFDERAALAYAGGDRRLLREVVSLFRADAPSSLRRIEKALGRRDGDALRAAAHALKGAIATLGGKAGRDAAAELEQIGRSGRLDRADRAWVALREQIRRLDAALVEAGLAAPARRRPATAKRPASGARKQKPHEQNPRRR